MGRGSAVLDEVDGTALLTRARLSTELNEMMEQAVWISVERVFQAKGTTCAKGGPGCPWMSGMAH